MASVLGTTICRISSVTTHAPRARSPSRPASSRVCWFCAVEFRLGASVRRMRAFEDKITHFQWLDLDGKHGTLRVWEDEHEAARLVLFTDDETGKTYVVADQTLPGPD
jgi:hypothetical protein